MPAKLIRPNLPLLFLVFLKVLSAQEAQPSETALLQSILQRMEALEKQNQQLAEELHQLRQQLADGHPAISPVEDRVAATENRVEEQAQTKVEASQKFPISLTGQLLFNTFANTGNVRALPNTTYSPFIATANTAGATVGQSMLGFNFRGPSLPGGGTVSAHMMFDLYSDIPSEQFDWLRMRTSDITLDWAHRSFSFAFDKPLISPRQPSSLAEVDIPPLADSGNLWLWLPQARYEERFKLGSSAGITAQAALIQTDETYSYTPAEYSSSLEKTRPAIEGRLAFWNKWSDARRLEVAAGFHESSTHVAQTSVPSRIFSVDWLATPFSKLEISGTFFHGQNFGELGAQSQSYAIGDNSLVTPVHGDGGWTQFSSPLTNRLTLNIFGGFQSSRPQDLQNGGVTQNLTYASNLMFHLSPNVILSVEALQMRSRLKEDGDLIHNRYDLALAYLF